VRAFIPFPRSGSQQARRAEDQDHDQNGEDERTRPQFADVSTAERTHQADDQSPQHRAGQIADAAEHGRGESIQPVLKTHLEADRVDVQTINHRRGAPQSAADGKRDSDDPIDIDAHQAGGQRVLLGRPHGGAHARELHEQRQRDHQRRRDADHHQVLHREANARVAEHFQQVVIGDQIGKVDIGRPAPEKADIHEDERDADGRDERREFRRVAQRAIDDAIDGDVQARTENRHHDQGDADAQQCRAEPRPLAADSLHDADDHAQRQERTEHEQVAVGEVDQPDDAVHHRIAQRDQGEERAVGQPDQAMLQQDFESGGRVASRQQSGHHGAGYCLCWWIEMK
jgi:hypothetical protein